MQKFLKLIDTYNAQGVCFPAKGNSLDTGPNAKKLTQEFAHIINEYIIEARTFVFDKGIAQTLPNYDIDHGRVLDMPFKSISIETSGGHPIMRNDNNNPHMATCAVITEVLPEQYSILLLIEPINSVGESRVVFASVKDASMLFAHYYLNSILKSETGKENVNIKQKVGSGKNKTRVEIRSVIHITKSIKKYEKIEGFRNIDWSHRFEVRGHWRKTDRIGKDRQGSYCVDGYTWVKDFVKGKEDLPLIKKQRMVHSDKNISQI